MSRTPIYLVCALFTLCTACQSKPRKPVSPSPTASTPIENTADYHYGTANVESVDAEILTGGPTRAKLRIRGLLNDGATTIHQVEQTRVSDGFVITVTTARLRSAIATLALVPFEREVILDLSSINSGPCQVRVNDVRTTFNVP